MLSKNLEVIVLLDLKKPTNRRKPILKFITVKVSKIFSQWRSLKDQVGNTAGMSAQLMSHFQAATAVDIFYLPLHHVLCGLVLD